MSTDDLDMVLARILFPTLQMHCFGVQAMKNPIMSGVIGGVFAAVVFGSVAEVIGWAFPPNKKPERLTFEQRISEEFNNQPRSK